MVLLAGFMRVCRRCHKLKDPRFFVKTTLHSIKTLKQCSSCRLQRSSSEKRKRIVSRSSNNIAVKKSKVNPSYRIESRCGARIKSWLGRKSIRVSQVQYELAFINGSGYIPFHLSWSTFWVFQRWHTCQTSLTPNVRSFSWTGKTATSTILSP